MKKDIVLFWMQWSWKWIQAKKIINFLSEKWVVCRDFEAWVIFRALQSIPNAIWNFVASVINNWSLLPDEFVWSIFNAFLITLKDHELFISDWFPRKIHQMNIFLDKCKNLNRSMIAICIDLSNDEAVKRIASRVVCEKCGSIYSTLDPNYNWTCVCWWVPVQRDDDYPEAILKRIWLYEKETLPVIESFNDMWILYRVNWNQSVDAVFEDIKKILELN